MIPTAQISVQAEHQHRLYPGVIRPPNFGDIPRHLSRSRITFAAQTTNTPHILLCCGNRQTLGKHAYHGMILLRALVSANDVVIEHGLQVPLLLLCHLREMAAAVEPLLLPRDRKKDYRRRELHLAQYASALQAHRGSAGIIVRSRSVAPYIQRVAVSRIV